ncbi:hypothetical protein MMC18_002190 [Xylographa bjoerkii]|nr:hypothetical protein [Xylographa bjoerkii]
MPITALPNNTTRAISSIQVLTDSVSVVKELVDNALDAQASTIIIELSANALDVIQVKDNGHGIAPDDRSLVCQPHCTSKIRDLEDVANIGGTSLGFRGQALASAAATSGCLVLTTKIEGEPVAACMKFARGGTIISQESVSHPVGTTVRVMDFLKHFPVRKQTAFKTAAKISSKVKTLLKAYALARPSVRFSFKVLKTRNDKDHWMYPSKAGATVTDAALKVINQQAVSQCDWHVWDSGKRTTQDSSLNTSVILPECSNDRYIIESLLPRKHCSIPSINRTGQYISIDSRPVSCTRGVLKQITSLYKSYLQSSRSAGCQDKVIEPFLCMNIVCPAESYDPNIEPAKDDVLFAQPETLLRAVETFFVSVYGEQEDSATEIPNSKESSCQQNSFDILLSSRNPNTQRKEDHGPMDSQEHKNCQSSSNALNLCLTESSASVNVCDESTLPGASLASLSTKANESYTNQLANQTTAVENRWKSGMYDADEDDDYDPESQGEADITLNEEDEPTSRDVENLNPWTIAKLNALVRRAKPNVADTENAVIHNDNQLLTPVKSRADRHDYSSPWAGVGSNSVPDLSMSTLPSPVLSPSTHKDSSPSRLPFSTNPWEGRIQHPPNAIEGNLQEPGGVFEIPERHVQESLGNANGFISARTLPTGTALSDIPDVSERPRKQSQRKPQWQQQQGKHHKPFASPLHKSSSVPGPPRQFGTSKKHRQWTDRETAHTSHIFDVESHDLTLRTDHRSSNGGRAMHPDLAVTMDFEERKQLAMQRRREQLRQQTLDMIVPNGSPNSANPSTSVSSPHKNRYKKAVAALGSSGPLSKPQEFVFEPSDPRGYLARVLTTESNGSLKTGTIQQQPPKRRKTANLPFEKIPHDEGMHDLVQTIRTTNETVVGQLIELAGCDSYVRSGTLLNGLDCTMEEAKSWETALQEVLQRSLPRKEGEPTTDARLDLWSILKQRHVSTISHLVVELIGHRMPGTC